MNTALAEKTATSSLLEYGEAAGHPGKAIFRDQQNDRQAISLTEGGNLEFKSFFFFPKSTHYKMLMSSQGWWLRYHIDILRMGKALRQHHCCQLKLLKKLWRSNSGMLLLGDSSNCRHLALAWVACRKGGVSQGSGRSHFPVTRSHS